MRLVVIASKLCWPSEHSPSGYATNGGFAFQMQAISELFTTSKLVLPFSTLGNRPGEVPIIGNSLSIYPILTPPADRPGRVWHFFIWLLRNGLKLYLEILRADAVHTTIPGEIGTVGMLLALLLGKPLFVRYCGNWFTQNTTMERFWHWFMETFANGKNIMFATGGGTLIPSEHNPSIHWIFATTLSQAELTRLSTKEVSLPDVALNLIIVCRQEKDKGTDLVIKSLPIIAQTYPNVRLDVVGDGSELDKLKALAYTLGVNERIRFHGRVDHHRVLDLLQQAHLLVYPTSSSEGFPKIVHEALACGLPVITSRVSVLPEIIGTGCGFLLDEISPEQISQLTIQCVSNIDQYKAMSIRAVHTAQQFSLEHWRDTIGEKLCQAWGPTR